ncbi:helix-turn-helix transcriptional regulator [Pelagibacterium xiamenense]|uniref:helix-turn-helix transcriptional regulator n=1 Tax=Pelagibacterium xiamenense TaxID=2901140 RepID=UPI001E46F2BC|nr:YafY family protein [Pelagibacterium xiamenense]MCD7061316.1 YafY family transcriptional regulator [Pelagibacterium xiamenense]
MPARSERLLELMQALRRRKRPVSAQTLAEEMGVSKRSIYRDINALKSMGAAIDGEAGIGYIVRAEYWLPPLTFSTPELEALVLGLRGMIHGPDLDLAASARDAEAKLIAALPPEKRHEMDAVALFAFPSRNAEIAGRLADMRRALREERVIHLGYKDRNDAVTTRDVWPVALGYRDDGQMLLAHCTLRNDFRSFAISRILEARVTDERMPKRRQTLLSAWIARNNLPDLR